MRLLVLSAVVVLVAVGGSGCSNQSFSVAKKADTAESYRRFLREFPNADEAEPAQQRLSELEFAQAKRLHTPLAYKRYLEEFPDGTDGTAARALLEGLRFNAAKEKNTADALRQFLKDHPDGAHKEEAQALLTEADFREAAAGKDLQRLAKVASEHGEDPRSAEVERALDDQAFQLAVGSGPARLLQYLADHPAGAHRAEAQVRLFSIRVDGLLFSGLLDEARMEAQRSPLAAQLPELPARIARAEQDQAAAGATDAVIQAALPAHYLRSLDDLEKLLGAPDPLDRWQAAEELGQHVTIRAIDPLLRALRTARNPLIRERAFESLGVILRALPRAVAEHEVANRLEQLRATAASPEAYLATAVLLDLGGRLDAAAVEYQRAFDSGAPDPLILWRWARIRQERRQSFSSAVAARALALWASSVAKEGGELTAEGRVPLAMARELCAAAEQARFAAEVISAARREKTEFPEDLVAFERQATDARKLTEARLADAELVLQTQDPHALGCADRRVGERLGAALTERRIALRTLAQRQPQPRQAREILRLAAEKDPALDLRAEAAALLSALPPLAPIHDGR